MPHVAAHIFRPLGSDTAAQRVICAEPGCYLTPDEHMEAMARALDDGRANLAPKAAPNGRGSEWTRAERIAAGMPVCLTHDCHRAPTPGRRGMCRRCYEASPAVRHLRDGRGAKAQLRDPVSFLALMEREMRDAIRERARPDGVSASEWVRRVIAAALGTAPRAPEKSVVGPDETDLAG